MCSFGLRKKPEKSKVKVPRYAVVQRQSLPLESKILMSELRIRQWYEHWQGQVYVAFSGGKDSTVMLHMVMDEAAKRWRKVGVCFIDLEGQYKVTIDHVRRCYEMYRDNIDPYWVCLPIHLRNAVSVYEPFWFPWEPEKKEAWIREPPKTAITDQEYFPFLLYLGLFVIMAKFCIFIPTVLNRFTCCLILNTSHPGSRTLILFALELRQPLHLCFKHFIHHIANFMWS